MNSYYIRTFGCQMNKHDSEVVAGLLEAEGLSAAAAPEEADLIVFLTCCVRENADERLRGQVASLKALKTDPDGRTPPLIAVGGCIAQRDGEDLLIDLPHVDIVFGTHNIERLPELLREAVARRERALAGETAKRYVPWLPDTALEVIEDSELFAADLPTTREHPWHGWLPITQGCDNYCTYCVVPYVRGREKSRPLDALVAHAEALVADGAREITLLGQNVNSYGRDLFGEPRFAQALRAVAQTGIERLGFATSHPKDLLPETIEVMATTPAVLTHLHLPVQSGSNRVLQAMNRRYSREHYLGLVAAVRRALPGITLSTDVIVGFPGETDEDFEDTLTLFQEVGYDQAFTFLYSPRAETPAARMEGQVEADVAQARFDRLVECVQTSARICNERLVGTRQTVLFEGASKRDPRILAGRTHGAKVLHMPLPEGERVADWAGRIVPVRVVDSATWYLLGEPLEGACVQ